MKKFIASLSLVAIFTLPVFVLPAPVHAQTSNSFANVGIGCLAGLGSSYLVDALNSLTKVPVGDSQQLNETIKVSCLDPLKRAVTQELLKKITQETTKWVNTGFEGNPFYLRDTQSYYNSLANEQVRDFVSELKLSNNPFSRDIAKSLVTQYTSSYSQKSGFNLDQKIGANWQDFNNDFSAGGWEGWLAMTQSSQNNPVGSYLNASNELAKRVQTNKETIKDELQANSGFLSMKKCVEKKDSSIGTPLDADDQYTFSVLGYNPSSESTNCARYETTTPGSIIQAQLDRSLGTGQKQLEEGNNLNDGITKVFTSLFTELYNGGVESIGDSGGTPSGSGSNILVYGGYGNNSIQNNLNPVNGGGGTTGLGANGSTHWFDVNPAFDITDPAQLQKVIDDQTTYIATLNAQKLAIYDPGTGKGFIPYMNQADYCVPGPHPNWESIARVEIAKRQKDVANWDEQDDTDAERELKHASFVAQWLGFGPKIDITIRDKGVVLSLIDRVFQGSDNLYGGNFDEGYAQKIYRRYNNSPDSLPASAGAIFDFYGKLAGYQDEIRTTPDINTGKRGELIEEIGKAEGNKQTLLVIKNAIADAKSKLQSGAFTQAQYDVVITTETNTFKFLSSNLATTDTIKNVEGYVNIIKEQTDTLANPTSGLIHQCEVEVTQGIPLGRRSERMPYPPSLPRPPGSANYATTFGYLNGYVYGYAQDNAGASIPGPVLSPSIPGENYVIHVSDYTDFNPPGINPAGTWIFERTIKIY